MSEYVCPTCGESFGTKRGRGVHHVHAHDRRLPNRTCDYCGKEFYSDYAKRYCSQDCLVASDSYSKENHPGWKGGKDTANCELCDSEFDYYPSEKKGLYCPDCVQNNEWRNPPKVSGPDNPRWSGGKTEKLCDVCGKSVRRYPSGFESDVVCCSEECRKKWLSDTFTGEGHPNWKGGPGNFYNNGWWPAKLAALDRDAHTCRVCGATRDDLERNPDVHHIIPVREFADPEDAPTVDNLICLCVTCHRNADVGNISEAELRRLVASS